MRLLSSSKGLRYTSSHSVSLIAILTRLFIKTISANMPIHKFSAKSLDGDIPDKPLIFVVEGRYQNWIKPIILLECLGIDYDTACLDGPATRTEWYTKIHPQRYVPAMIDAEQGNRVTVWDSSQILQYLANKYDEKMLWNGTSPEEQVEIGNWLTFETASLGYITVLETLVMRKLTVVGQLRSTGYGMRFASQKTRTPKLRRSEVRKRIRQRWSANDPAGCSMI